MLRALVLILLLANGGYYAWSHHWLQRFGFAPQSQGEPERLRQQIRPEYLRVVPARVPAAKDAESPSPASALSAPSPTVLNTVDAMVPTPVSYPSPATVLTARQVPTECLQVGIFDGAQAEALRRAAAVLPEGSWKLEAATLPGRWMVYMGRLSDAEGLTKKRNELRELGIDFARPGAALEPGLSLGRFSTEEAAQRALVNLTKKGVRAARIVQERLDLPGFMLRLPTADAQLKAQARALGAVLVGKTLRACS